MMKILAQKKDLEDAEELKYGKSQNYNRLYGSFWLLEQISKKISLYDDLLEVFNGNILKIMKFCHYPSILLYQEKIIVDF